MRKRLASSAVLVAIVLTAVSAFPQNRTDRWVTTWGTALVARPQTPPAPAPAAAPQQATAPAAPGGAPAPAAPAPPPAITNQTLRQIVHTSIGGDRVRLTLSNAFGTAPLEIGAASIALRDKDAAIVERSSKRVTFSGNPSFTIPPGAVAISDPIDLQVPAVSDVAVDLYLPGDLTTSPYTIHNGALQTNYVSATGNHAGMAAPPVMTTTTSWFLLARLEVAAAAPVTTVVALGDSITDGTRSTVNTNNRWPDHLARRLAADRSAPKVAVVNAGIAGNRVLTDGAGVNALARFDRDVLLQPGVTHVVVMEGINDIGLARANPSPAAADLIAAHRQLIERAHARGLRIYGATLTPFEGAAYWTAEGQAKRDALNQWIRTSRAYDGVIDFDAVLRDPGAPTKFLPQYDSGDHLHPNDAGYQAMGNAVDLSLFLPPPEASARLAEARSAREGGRSAAAPATR
jgi:lysophospholipase L1-like esterase